MAHLVEHDAVKINARTGTDREIDAGVDPRIARGGHAVGWRLISRGERGRVVIGINVAGDPDVAEARIALSVPRRVEGQAGVGRRDEVDVGGGGPSLKILGDLILPDLRAAELGVEDGVKVCRAAVPLDAVGNEAEGDLRGIGPLRPFEGVVSGIDDG